MHLKGSICDYLKKKYRKAEYVQRRVPSSNAQVLFVFEVVLSVILFQWVSSIKGRLPSTVLYCQWSSSVKGRLSSKVVFCLM